MISNRYDLNKTRYTHRDYESIKADLIAAIPSLTQEWTSREESDPGIVLIKLMAMFGDTLSYNVDKIALELYIQSVTQRKNCAKILKLLGYKMHWYRAGRVIAHVRLARDEDDQGNPIHAILTPYQTVFRAGNTSYVVANQGVGSGQIDISSSTTSVPVRLIQGRSMSVTFSQGELVENRYYLGSVNIDESEFRMFVSGGRAVECQLTDNLYLVSSNRIVYYEFDVDEYDRPYIQLADNWKDIVGASDDVKFTLTYIINDGSLGNISSNAFTTVLSFLGAPSSDLVITNLPNTTKYGENGTDLDSYNTPGYDPQTVEEARADSANYVFTHDTLVTSSDYEKAAKRVTDITVSKMVDAQVILNDHLDLDELISRALDHFEKVEVEEESTETPEVYETNEYLKQSQVILYLGYRNFNPQYNWYFTSATARTSDWSLYTDGDPYALDTGAMMDAGFYPYKPNQNILQSVRDEISSLHTLNVNVDFGTLKLFPFKVMGTLHLVEPKSPQECLQIVDTVNAALEQAYYPSLHPVGEKPNFIEIVDVIQNSDVRIKYFDAIGNIIEWAPAVQAQAADFDTNFDTTSAIMYNGLSDKFSLSKNFLNYRLKNVGINIPAGYPADYGTAYLINYSTAAGLSEVKTIARNTIETLQLNSIAELRALCEDMWFVGEATIGGQSVRVNNTGLQWAEV